MVARAVTPVEPGSTPAQRPAGGQDLGTFVNRHKVELAAGGIGVVALVAYLRRKSSSSSSSSSAPGQPAGTYAAPVVYPGGYSTSGNETAQQLEALQNDVANLESGSSSSTQPGQAGYFLRSSSPEQTQQLLAAGLPVEYQVPGTTIVEPVTDPQGPTGPWETPSGSPLPDGAGIFYPSQGTAAGTYTLNPTPGASGAFSGTPGT